MQTRQATGVMKNVGALALTKLKTLHRFDATTLKEELNPYAFNDPHTVNKSSSLHRCLLWFWFEHQAVARIHNDDNELLRIWDVLRQRVCDHATRRHPSDDVASIISVSQICLVQRDPFHPCSCLRSLRCATSSISQSVPNPPGICYLFTVQGRFLPYIARTHSNLSKCPSHARRLRR